MERILELLREQGQPFEAPAPDAYAVVQDATLMPQVLQTLAGLRERGVSVQMHAGGADGFGAMKKQFKKADASGARFALVFGGDEIAAGEISVKPLRGEVGADGQARIALADLDGLARRLLD
jgi:histidyl-tRNA synthetase